ncbi:terminase, partial [Lacticaseibacillus rhamnosus]
NAQLTKIITDIEKAKADVRKSKAEADIMEAKAKLLTDTDSQDRTVIVDDVPEDD